MILPEYKWWKQKMDIGSFFGAQNSREKKNTFLGEEEIEDISYSDSHIILSFSETD